MLNFYRYIFAIILLYDLSITVIINNFPKIQLIMMEASQKERRLSWPQSPADNNNSQCHIKNNETVVRLMNRDENGDVNKLNNFYQ